MQSHDSMDFNRVGEIDLEDMRQGRDMIKWRKLLEKLEEEGRFSIEGLKRGELPYVK